MKYLSFLLLPFFLIGCTTLQNPIFETEAGALRGYDPVAYFDGQPPQKGHHAFPVQHQGTTWYFASEAHRQQFRQDPERYIPQYGGYCAYGMSKGFVVSSDPHAWQIHQGRLYLNYSLSVRETWRKDIPGNILLADQHWAKKVSN